MCCCVFFFQAEDGIRDLVRSRGLGDVYKRQGLDLGVGQFLDLFEHLLRAGAGRQLGDDELPLAAGQVLDLPARAHLQRAAAGGLGGADVFGAAADLAAGGVAGGWQEFGQGAFLITN